MPAILRQLTGSILCAALLLISQHSVAATMDISASFTPSVQNPQNNSFENTTPQSGYCQRWPSYCPAGVVSIALPITTTLKRPIVANDTARNNPYFGLTNKQRSLTVTNEATGETASILFRISGFSSEYSGSTGQYDWQGGSFMYPNAPCAYSGVSVGGGNWYAFLWKVSESDGACYKISTVDRTEPSRFYNMSISYDLVTPDPLKLGAGVFKGTVPLTVGPGGNIDFGDVYEASDNELNINFTLTVTHELKLTATPENSQVSLQPCQPGRVCTADEGKANWERWMVSRITPQLTGRSNFNLSSSGAFTVYLDCAQQAGADCALKSSSTGQLVPVQSLLTLPDNIVDSSTGSAVRQKRLAIGKDVTSNVFSTRTYGQDRQGSIDFLVKQRDVDTMLSTRPDSYSGTVTVIFDPNLY